MVPLLTISCLVVLFLFAFQQASCGVALGVGLSVWEPEDANSKAVTLKWVGLVGDMFIRSLKAIVLPLVFVNVVISVVDMMSLGRASAVGWKTLGLYTLTTLIASIIGLISIVMFKNRFEDGTFSTEQPVYIKLGCNAAGEYLTELADGSIQCLVADDDIALEENLNNNFIVDDVSGTFARVNQGARNDIHSAIPFTTVFSRNLSPRTSSIPLWTRISPPSLSLPSLPELPWAMWSFIEASPFRSAPWSWS